MGVKRLEISIKSFQLKWLLTFPRSWLPFRPHHNERVMSPNKLCAVPAGHEAQVLLPSGPDACELATARSAMNFKPLHVRAIQKLGRCNLL